MTDQEHVSASLTDEERIERWEALCADHDGHKSSLIRQLIDDEYDRRDLDVRDTGEVEETAEGDDRIAYEPFHHEGRPTGGLSREQLKSVLADYDQPAIHPEDVGREVLPKYVQSKKDVVAAVARFRAIEHEDHERVPSTKDVKQAVRIVGLNGDSRTVKQYKKVRERFKSGGVGQADNVDPARALDIADSVDDWVEETREEFLADGIDHPQAVYEKRREQAATMWRWVDEHGELMECLDDLITIVEEASDEE